MGAAGIAALPVLAKAAKAEEAFTPIAAPADLSKLKRIRRELVAPPYVHVHEQVSPGEPRIVEFEMETVEKEIHLADA